MRVIKGFMVMQALSDNTPDTVSPLGELSTYAKTFTRDLTHYAHPDQANVDWMVFHSAVDGVRETVPVGYQNVILPIAEWLYQESVAGAFSASSSDMVSRVLAEYASDVDDVSVGEMVQGDQDSLYLPEWIQFTLRGTEEENQVKVWLSDESFRRQYDEYEILIVPPLEPVDDLLRLPVEVKADLDQITPSEQMQRIQQTQGDDPPTRIRIETYEWSHPEDDEVTLDTEWTIILYGPAGDTIDNIQKALTEYVLSNSDSPRSEWEQFIPNLFLRTEFMIIPLWDNFSIPNETLTKGLHSPTVRYANVLPVARNLTPAYPDAHVDNVVCVSVASYRSMSFLAIGGPDNTEVGSNEIFADQFSDYLVMPTTSSEFSRMSQSTQDFIVTLSEMLKITETMDEFSDVPLDMSRVERNGLIYLVASHEDIQYLVLSRESYYRGLGLPLPPDLADDEEGDGALDGEPIEEGTSVYEYVDANFTHHVRGFRTDGSGNILPITAIDEQPLNLGEIQLAVLGEQV